MNWAGAPWIFSSLQEGQRRPCGPSFTLSGAKAVPPTPAWLARSGPTPAPTLPHSLPASLPCSAVGS